MPHAEASTFASGQTKHEMYDQVLEQSAALFDGQTNWVCNTANAAALLYHGLKSLRSPSADVNWAGFYFLSGRNKLVLGPFQGQVACTEIEFGRGVCGTSAQKRETVLVPDVEKFPGHIACDSASKSEIVVPIVVHGSTVAIIDIDCAELSGFDAVDELFLGRLASLLAEKCDWKGVLDAA